MQSFLALLSLLPSTFARVSHPTPHDTGTLTLWTDPALAHVALAGPPLHIGSLLGPRLGATIADSLHLKCYASPCETTPTLVADWIPQRPPSDTTTSELLQTGELWAAVQGRWEDGRVRDALIDLAASAAVQSVAADEGNCWTQGFTSASNGKPDEMRMCSTARYIHAEYEDGRREMHDEKAGGAEKRPYNYVRIVLSPVDNGRLRKELSCAWNTTVATAIEEFRGALGKAGRVVPGEVPVWCCQEGETCVKLPLDPN